jgi:glycosyltransferase involved in cell wall biosynthesis
VIANSLYTLAHIQNTYSTDQRKLAIAPRGYDETRYNSDAAPADQVKLLRQSWNLPTTTTQVLMMVGRLTRLKGHGIVLEALSQLVNQKWVCVFVGSGRPEFEAELKQLAQQYGVAERIIWAGAQTNIPLYMAAADICISASTQPESFGRTIVEAQAMGTPVIATNHGGAMELVDRNITGWFVPPNNANALAQAIKKALQQPLNDKRNMLAACRAWASQFTTEKMCAAEMSVYKEVLGL